MAFTRSFLTNHGVPEDQVDAIMAERNRTLTDYVPKADVQAQIDAAVQAALKDAPQAVDPTTTDAYKALQQENDKLKTFSSEEFSSVKPKFRDYVYGKIDRSEGAASVADQLAAMREDMGEVFEALEPTPPAAVKGPQFGAKLDRVPPAKEMSEADKIKASFEAGWQPANMKKE